MLESAVKRLSQIVQWYLVYPVLYAVLALRSEITRWKTRGRGPAVRFETAYDGQPVLLLALYQKGVLRPDIARLARAAKDQGLYVLAVNTLTLNDVDAVRETFDAYIERPNFGRDFGSYKAGFLHLFATGAADRCPRLILCNDSVFYARERLAGFLTEMRETDREILGSTENFEIEHHLGSFCISLSNRVLNHPKFREYWRGYRLTDVRPRVIERGEIRLSRVLRRCASSDGEYASLYNANRYAEALGGEEAALDVALWNMRRSDVFLWPRFEPRKVERFLSDGLIVASHPPEDGPSVKVEAGLDELMRAEAVSDYASLENYLLRNVAEKDGKAKEIVRNAVIAELTRIFLSGSQIHGSAAILLWLGLPIVKLDGLYRGAFNVYDVRRMCQFLGGEDGRELPALLLSRPFGGETLYGWKRAAFSFGLI